MASTVRLAHPGLRVGLELGRQLAPALRMASPRLFGHLYCYLNFLSDPTQIMF